MPILGMKSMKVMLCSRKCTWRIFLDSVFGVVQSKSFGGLSNNDGDGYENVTQQVKFAASNFIALIPSRLICHMWATDLFTDTAAILN